MLPSGTALSLVLRCTLDVRSGSKRDPLLSARMSASASCGHQRTRGQTPETPKSAGWVGLDIEGGEGKSVCMASLLRRTAHLPHRFVAVKGTNVQVCDALQVSVSQRSQIFGAASLFAPGDERADRGKTQKPDSQNSKFQRLQIAKTKLLKTFMQFFPRDRSRNCFPQDRILVLTIGGKTFASSSP